MCMVEDDTNGYIGALDDYRFIKGIERFKLNIKKEGDRLMSKIYVITVNDKPVRAYESEYVAKEDLKMFGDLGLLERAIVEIEYKCLENRL